MFVDGCERDKKAAKIVATLSEEKKEIVCVWGGEVLAGPPL